jgi:uncharacterized damage-inducible protein DinB
MNILAALFVHNDWARDKLMGLASPLSDEQLDRPFDIGPGCLRAVLLHLYGCERNWLGRWLERELAEAPSWRERLSMGDLWAAFRKVADIRSAFLDRIGEAGLSRKITFVYAGNGKTYTFPIGDMALHVTNHGHHHRAQAANMLRHLGAKLPGLDYLYMKIEPSPPPPPKFDRDTLREYYRYGDWAMERVLDCCSGLGDDPLDRPFEMGLGSLRKSLTHIRDAEQWWQDNWTSDDPKLPWKALPETTSIAQLRRLFRETAGARFALLDRLEDVELQRSVSAQPSADQKFTFALGETMLQLCGHGVYHRAQAINMLRRVGGPSPGEVDYIDWYEQVGCG